MTKPEFVEIIRSLGQAWTRRDYDTAAGFFTEDVHYSDPVRYTMTSRAELLEFFSNDEGYDQNTVWHRILFDEEAQEGVAEYTYEGTRRYHGAVLVTLREDLIRDWLEYQRVEE